QVTSWPFDRTPSLASAWSAASRRPPASTSNLPRLALRTTRFCRTPRAAISDLSWASATASLVLRTLRGLGASFFNGIDWNMGLLLIEGTDPRLSQVHRTRRPALLLLVAVRCRRGRARIARSG